MKKISLLLVAMFAVMVLIPSVYAEERSAESETALKSAIEDLKSSGGTIKLTDNINVASDIITIEDATGHITIDLNDHFIKRTAGNTVFDVKNSTVTFKDSGTNGTIEHSSESSIYADEKSNVTIESGNYKGGISAWGNNVTINIKGGNIIATKYAVAGNGSSTINSTINISGGILKSTGTAAIYQAQNGNLTITGGEIIGKIGIVARQGNVQIKGGKINATGTPGETITVGDNKQPLPNGVGVIVDNIASGYTEDAKVNVAGSVSFETTGAPVNNYGDDANTDKAITIGEGPTFNQDVNTVYLADGLVQASNGKVMTETEYRESLKSKDSVSNTDTQKNPNTSDNVGLYFVMALMGLALAGVTTRSLVKHN